jgi:hypothetical protein
MAKAKRTIPKTKPKEAKRKRKSAPSSEGSSRDHTLYKDFAIYSGKKSPPWHPVKKMRYVFFRMIGGFTITDALREIHWNAAEFWHLVDLKRYAPFREEYKRAKTLQGRSFSDSVVTIAEGRDRVTRKHKKKIEKLINKAMGRIAHSKSSFKSKMILSQLMSDLREHDKIIMSRNKLQIEGAKWIAKTSNPSEFSETSKLSLNGGSGDGGETQDPILIQFVGPDGQVVDV